MVVFLWVLFAASKKNDLCWLCPNKAFEHRYREQARKKQAQKESVRVVQHAFRDAFRERAAIELTNN